MKRSANLIFVTLIAAPLCLGCGDGMPPEPRANKAKADQLRNMLEVSSSSGGGSGPIDNLSEPTGWATLRGSFKLSGAAPASVVALKVDKDQAICAPGGKAVLGQSLVVDPATKGIANIALFVDKIPESWVHEEATGSTDEVIFDQKACIFLSHVATMQTTQSLKILNSDPIGHNTKIDKTPFNSTVGAGQYATFKPSKAGRNPFEVGCSVHPWMKAHLLVRDNAYMAVTKPDGSFEIPNLPAGVELQFKVWQESAKINQVSVNGSPAKWNGRFNITLDANDDSKNQIDVVIDASTFN